VTYDQAYADSKIPSLVEAAIEHANWHADENSTRLRTLASAGKEDEIRAWGKELRADHWDRVADAIRELRTSLIKVLFYVNPKCVQPTYNEHNCTLASDSAYLTALGVPHTVTRHCMCDCKMSEGMAEKLRGQGYSVIKELR
jgi:hypothetical protein